MFNLIPYPWRNGRIARKDNWFDMVDRAFEDFFRDPFFTRMSAIASPFRANVKETDKEYIVEAELPGVNKEDIIVDLNDDILTIGVDVKKETREEDNGYIYRERHDGSFRRSFQVYGIKNEDVTASYKKGLLIVTLPKANPGKRERRIKIE